MSEQLRHAKANGFETLLANMLIGLPHQTATGLQESLDVFVVSTANPEGCTNLGRIVTPLKDRYGFHIHATLPIVGTNIQKGIPNTFSVINLFGKT